MGKKIKHYEIEDDLASLFEKPKRSINKSKEIDDLTKRYPKMARSIAGQIVCGELSLTRYIAKLNKNKKTLKIKKIDFIMNKYPDVDRSMAGQIVSGKLSIEECLNILNIKKKKESKRIYFRNRVEKLIKQYPAMTEKIAKKIVLNHFTIEDYLASCKKKADKIEKHNS